MRTQDVLRIVHKATARTRLRVGNMLTRLVIDAAVDSAGFQQLNAEALANEDLDEIEHFQPGGLTHVPLTGAEGVLLSVGGSREVAIALGVANRDQRPKGLTPGETGLYLAIPTVGGLKVLCRVDGTLALGDSAAAESALRGDTFLTTLKTLTDALAVLVVALVPVNGVAPGAQAIYAAADTAWKAAIAVPGATPPTPETTSVKSGYVKVP